MFLSLSVDGNNPLLHILGLTTKFTILMITIGFVFNLILDFPNRYFGKDPWPWHRTNSLDPNYFTNIYNWFYWIESFILILFLAGAALTIFGFIFLLLIAVKIGV